MSQLGFILSICPLTHRWGLEAASTDDEQDRMPMVVDFNTAETIIKGREAADQTRSEQSGRPYHFDHYYFVPLSAIGAILPTTPAEIDPKLFKPITEEDKMRTFLMDTLKDGPDAVADFDKALKAGMSNDAALVEAMTADRMQAAYKSIGGEDPMISSMLGSLGRMATAVRKQRKKGPTSETFRDEETPTPTK